MTRAEELLKQLNDSRQPMEKYMTRMMSVFAKASGQSATEFNKAYREATAWQHQRKKPSEGIGGA